MCLLRQGEPQADRTIREYHVFEAGDPEWTYQYYEWLHAAFRARPQLHTAPQESRGNFHCSMLPDEQVHHIVRTHRHYLAAAIFRHDEGGPPPERALIVLNMVEGQPNAGFSAYVRVCRRRMSGDCWPSARA